MSLMPSLCAALERAGGDRLVMRAGERPHVLAGDRRHDVASAILSINAVEALAEQILSPAARQELRANGSASEAVHSSSFPHPLTAKAERVGDDFCIELLVSAPAVEAVPPAPTEFEIVHTSYQPETYQPETASVDEPPQVEELRHEEAPVVHAIEDPTPLVYESPIAEVASTPIAYEPRVESVAPAPMLYELPVASIAPASVSYEPPVGSLASDPIPYESPVASVAPAPIPYEPPAAPVATPPTAYEPPSVLPAPGPIPIAERVVEPVRHEQPAPIRQPEVVPVRQPDVTVVTRMQEPVRAPRPVTPANSNLDLSAWISHASDLGATTLYLRAGSPAAGRIDERIQPISQEMVSPTVIEEAVAMFTRGGDGMWEPRGDGEWAREDDELGYVSCRVFADVQGSGLIIQLRPSTSLRLLYKHIPRQVRTACEGNGLVVVAASTEADVEALAAAVADWSGRDRGGYLISLQRRSRSHGEIAGAFVSQRTIAGSDKDFAAAIRRAAQEGPDILLVTGLQSEQPLQAAVLAAAGDRLVIAGVVAPTTVEALQMMAGNDSHVRRAMATSFRAAIGYRSLRRIGGGRTLIQDVVLATSSVCGLLEAGNFTGLARIQNDVASKMRSVDESLARAVTRRQVSLREAAGQAIDRSHLVALVRSQARTSSSGKLALAGGRDVARTAMHHDGDHRVAASGMISGFSRY
jgi:Tfp pilus assembly pilus retraction ATPase PilT